MVEVVGILVAAGDGEHAGAQDVGDAVRDQQRIALVGDQRGQPVGDAQPPLGSRQQHHAAIGSDASAIERGSDFLASDGWKTERQQAYRRPWRVWLGVIAWTWMASTPNP